jgi:hypothetical protein
MRLKTNILIEAEITSETSCLHFMVYLTTTLLPVTVEFELNWKDFEQNCPYPTDDTILGLTQTEENHKDVCLIRNSKRGHLEYKSKAMRHSHCPAYQVSLTQ